MMTGSVLIHRTMSRDGFTAGPSDSLDWMAGYPSPSGVDEIIRTTGAIVAGRRTYDVGSREASQPDGRAYGGAWSGPVFILTHQSPPPDDDTVTFLSTDIATAVDRARAVAGEGNVEVFGADLSRQCFDADLVDEMIVHIVPVLLGDGVRIHQRAAGATITLELDGSDRTGPGR